MEKPKNNAERVQLALLAKEKSLHATATRAFAEAFANDPKLADDLQARNRYAAACAASLAGSDRGKDDPPPDAAAKARLRRQALDWLKADLSAWERVAQTVEPGNKELVARALARWKADTELAGIRDEAELAKLPEAERKEWQSLWADVETLLKRTQGGTP